LLELVENNAPNLEEFEVIGLNKHWRFESRFVELKLRDYPNLWSKVLRFKGGSSDIPYLPDSSEN
jgi:hypothetical protein